MCYWNPMQPSEGLWLQFNDFPGVKSGNRINHENRQLLGEIRIHGFLDFTPERRRNVFSYLKVWKIRVYEPQVILNKYFISVMISIIPWATSTSFEWTSKNPDPWVISAQWMTKRPQESWVSVVVDHRTRKYSSQLEVGWRELWVLKVNWPLKVNFNHWRHFNNWRSLDLRKFDDLWRSFSN